MLFFAVSDINVGKIWTCSVLFQSHSCDAEQSQLQSDIEQSQRELHRQFPFRKLTAYVHLVLGYVSRWGLLGA